MHGREGPFAAYTRNDDKAAELQVDSMLSREAILERKRAADSFLSQLASLFPIFVYIL